MPAEIRKRSVTIAGHRTSVSIETAFWRSLTAIAEQRGVTLGHLIAEIDRARTGNLSSAIRVFVLHETRAGAEAAGGQNLGGQMVPSDRTAL